MSDKQNRDILVGRNPVIEALKSGRDIDKIYIAKGSSGSVEKIIQLARDRRVRVDMVERALVDKMAPGENHQGVAARIPAYKYADMSDIFAKAEASGEDPFIVILDGIEDPHNLGAVIRTAECAGAHGVIIPKRGACGITSVAAKASAGAIESMPVVQVTNIARTIEELKERNIWITACDMGGVRYYDLDLTGGVGLVIGNEGRGISRLVLEKCDFVASIPLMGRTNSLNASNAAAVMMYEVRRRRLQ